MIENIIKCVVCDSSNIFIESVNTQYVKSTMKRKVAELIEITYFCKDCKQFGIYRIRLIGGQYTVDNIIKSVS